MSVFPFHLESYIEAEAFPGTRFVRRGVCRSCREVCYEVEPGASKAAIHAEIQRLKLHLSLCREILVEFLWCSDERCTGLH